MYTINIDRIFLRNVGNNLPAKKRLYNKNRNMYFVIVIYMTGVTHTH
jgi:hypothetical protein